MLLSCVVLRHHAFVAIFVLFFPRGSAILQSQVKITPDICIDISFVTI